MQKQTYLYLYVMRLHNRKNRPCVSPVRLALALLPGWLAAQFSQQG